MSQWSRAGLLLGGAWLILSCDDSSGPSADSTVPVPAEIGDTLTVRVDSAGAGRTFLIRSATDVDIAVFIQATQGLGFVSLHDSATGTLGSFGSAPLDPDPTHLLLHRTAVTHLTAGQAWLITVDSRQLPRPTRLRLWIYRVNRAPEFVPPTLTAGDTVTGETLENSADIDEFQLPVTAGEEIIGFLKTAPGVPDLLHAFHLYLPGSSTPLTSLPGGGSNADLEGLATGLVPIPAAGSSRIVVFGTGENESVLSQGTGPYQLLFRQVNRAPEAIGAVVPVNDTVVGEAIDHVGDIDEYTATVVAGESYRVFLQTTSGAPSARLRVRLPALALAIASSNGDTALANNFTDTFFPTTTGPIQLQVEGIENTFGLHRGSYRLFLYHIHRLPELVPATFTAGDSVIAETIEYPGDIDSFTVIPSASGFVNYVLRQPGSQPGALQFNWPTTNSASGVRCAANIGAPISCGGGTHAVPPAGEWLTLQGDPAYRGAFEIRSDPIDTLPEVAPSAIMLGQPMLETITPIGDIDRFQVTAGPGELFDLEFAGGNSCSCDSFILSFAKGTAFLLHYSGSGPTWRTGRFAFPDTGTYTMVVSGSNGGTVLTETGSYQFTLRIAPVGTETAAPALTASDTVSTEAIDWLGDLDEFTVTAPAGQEIIATVTPQLEVDALDPATPDTLRTGPGGATGIVTIPAGGQLRLRVFEPRPNTFSIEQITTAFQFLGGYTLALQVLNRAPESAPVAVTRGAQVFESIEHIGDIDEYTYAGVAGDTASITLDNLPSYGNLPLLLELVNPVDGSVLTSTNTQSQTPNTAPTVTLPVTGSYLIRLRSMVDQEGSGSYDFTVR